MIYILQENSGYDPIGKQVAFEGPDGLDAGRLRDSFFRNFYFPNYTYPKYVGPMKKYYRESTAVCSSGTIPMIDGQLVPDNSSKEYAAWEKSCAVIRNKAAGERDRKVKELKKKYDGRNEDEMFVSYLKKDFGFKEIDAVFVDV